MHGATLPNLGRLGPNPVITHSSTSIGLGAELALDHAAFFDRYAIAYLIDSAPTTQNWTEYFRGTDLVGAPRKVVRLVGGRAATAALDGAQQELLSSGFEVDRSIQQRPLDRSFTWARPDRAARTAPLTRGARSADPWLQQGLQLQEATERMLQLAEHERREYLNWLSASRRALLRADWVPVGEAGTCGEVFVYTGLDGVACGNQGPFSLETRRVAEEVRYLETLKSTVEASSQELDRARAGFERQRHELERERRQLNLMPDELALALTNADRCEMLRAEVTRERDFAQQMSRRLELDLQKQVMRLAEAAARREEREERGARTEVEQRPGKPAIAIGGAEQMLEVERRAEPASEEC